jgi:endonuclease/exonuclease/phosphatase (EEP) superfamily protein YafD
MTHDFITRFLHALAHRARYGLCLVAVALLLGLPGRWHWFPELFSHFLVQYELLLLLLTALLFWERAGHWRWAALALSVLLGCLLSPLWLPTNAAVKTGTLTTRVNFLQFNARQNTEPLTHWLIERRQEVDIVLVLEADSTFEAGMAALAEDFPYRLDRLDNSPFGIALLSRYPLHEEAALDIIGPEFPALDARIITPSGPLHLIGIHPPPPLGEELAALHGRFMENLASRIESGEPTLVLGDFNATVWSPRLREFMAQTQLRDAQQGFGLSGSWPSATVRYARFLGIPIDLALVSDAITVEERHIGPHLGSDHLPVLTRVVY